MKYRERKKIQNNDDVYTNKLHYWKEVGHLPLGVVAA